jgi:hypothetical protein
VDIDRVKKLLKKLKYFDEEFQSLACVYRTLVNFLNEIFYIFIKRFENDCCRKDIR